MASTLASFGNGGGIRIESGVGLQGQLIVGNVFGSEVKGAVQIFDGLIDALLGQGVHKIQIEIVEAGGARAFNRRLRFLGIVHAPQSLQTSVIEALDSDREPVDAGGAKSGESTLFSGAGVGLQRDFQAISTVHAPRDALQESGDAAR